MNNYSLKFGDLIIIQGTIQNAQNTKKASKETLTSEATGFLSAVGFTETRVFLQRVPEGASDPLMAASYWNNYRELIFQIWPKCGYEAQKQLKKLKKEKRLMAKNVDADTKMEFEEKLTKMENRTEDEKESNEKLLTHVMGMPVFYGSEIQLMHATSRTFLTSKVACSDSDKSAYKFELSDEFNSGMTFKLLPKYQIRQEGEPVQFQDEILIFSVKLNCYVNFTTDQVIARDREVVIPPNLPKITNEFEHRYMTKGTKRYEAHISQFRDCVWKMHYYGEDRREKANVVKGGDLVKLKHTENQSLLAADIPMQGKNPEVYGRIYYGEYAEEANNLNTIWEVEVENHENRGEACLLKDENESPCPIKLRHLLTGKLITIDNVPTPDGAKNVATVGTWDPSAQKRSPDLVFHSFANTPSSELLYNTAYALGLSSEKNNYKYITLSEDGDYAQYKINKETDTHRPGTTRPRTGARPGTSNRPSTSAGFINIYKPLREAEYSTRKHVVLCESSEPNAEHAFILTKVSPEEEYQILYAASSISRLKNTGDLIKAAKAANDINVGILIRTIESIEHLIFFLHKIDQKNIETLDPVTFEGITIQERQRMLKDCKVIELLTELLFYPFYLKLFTLENISNKLYQKIFQLCYRLIKHTIKEYRPNEIYAAQWLEYFMAQAMKSTAENDIKAEATLIELIDNNKKILDTKIDREMIFKFVQMLRENKNSKFIKLLRALCVCDGEPVISNQTEMSRFIIEDEEVRDQLIFQQFRRNNDIIEVRVQDYDGASECWVSLPAFETLSKEIDGGEKYDYFLNMIYLLADLCLDRNYITMDYLENIYTYDICFQIISAETSGWELKTAFAKLLNNLWIDRKPYQLLNLPKYLILWDEINQISCEQITSDKHDGRFFESLKNYLKQYFGVLAKQGCTQIYEMERNNFTSVLLELTLKMVQFGQYKTIDQLKELVIPLMKLLNGMRDVTTPEEYDKFQRKLKKGVTGRGGFGMGDAGRNTARYAEGEDTLVVMNCKVQICEIFKVVMTIADDLCLRKFLLDFRNELDYNKEKDRGNESSNNVSFSNPPTASLRGALLGAGLPQNNRTTNPGKSIFGGFGNLNLNLNLNLPTFQLFKGNDGAPDFIEGSVRCFRNITEQNPLDLNKLAPTNFVRMLFDLSLYEKEDLVNDSFGLLYDAHSQRHRLREMFEQVQILDDPDKKRAVQDIEQHVKDLREIAESTETWYGQEGQEDEEDAKKCIQLIKKLGSYLVSDNLSYENNAEPDAEFIVVNKDKALLEEDSAIGGDDQEIDSEFQRILRHMKANEPMLEILEFENSNPPDEKNERKIAILKEIFKFLAKFVRSEKGNQNALMEHMPMYLNIMKNYPTCGAESLIEALFKDNKKLTRQTEPITKFARIIMRIISELGLSNHKSSKFLLYLYVCMKHKKQVIKANQTAVLAQLSSRDFNEIFLNLDTQKKKDDIQEKLRAFNQQVEQINSVNQVELPGQLDYVCSLLEIMSYACEGKNGITESRSQTAWPLKDLAFLYEKAGHCWVLKRAVLLFFYHVYLDTEREMKEEKDNTNKLFLGMIKDMEEIRENLTVTYEVKYHKGVVPTKTIQDNFYYEVILPTIHDFLTKRLYSHLPNYKDGLTLMLKSLIRMEQSVTSRSHKKEIKSIIGKFRVHAHDIYRDVFSNPTSLEHVDAPKLPNYVHKTSNVSENVVAKEETNTKTLKLKTRLMIMNQRQDFIKYTDDEFEAMIKTLISIEKQEENDPFSCVLPFNDVIKSLINIFDITKSSIRKELMLIGLKLFRKIIERENKAERVPAADWEGEEWTKFEKKIVEKQTQLCELGLVNMICNTISETKDHDLQFESILVGIALLIGGNANVQAAFLEYMQNDTQNKFMWSIKALIDRHFEIIKKEMNEKSKEYVIKLLAKEAAQANEKAKQLGKGKSGDFNGSSTNINSDLQSAELEGEEEVGKGAKEADPDEATNSLNMLEKIYRFLQLFCEGHNLDMQNHLRVQTDTDGTINGKSVDFMSVTTYYFNTLIKTINVDCLDVVAQMLDFLIEGMQGPCEGNQQALAKAKIINTCMDFLMMFSKPRDYYKQGFIEADEIADANACTTTAMKLLNTLIEGNSNPDIIEEMSKLDFRFLIQKLTQEYETFVTVNLRLNVKTSTPAKITERLKADSFNEQILESFDIYILIANLAESSPHIAAILKNVEDLGAREKKALEFYRLNLGNIEILFNDKLLKVYFPIYPVCRYLTGDSRKRLMTTVNRDSATEKIMGLVNASDELFDEMHHMAFLKSFIFAFSQKRYNHLRDISTFISLGINILILISAHYYVEEGESVKEIKNFQEFDTTTAIDILGYCQLVTSSLMIVFWVIINAPMVLRRKWREVTEENKTKEEGNFIVALLDEDPDIEELPLNIVLEILLRKGPYDPIFNKDGKRNYGHLFVRLVCYWKNLTFICSEGKFVYIVFYFMISIIGFTISEITYCVHLLDVVNRFDTLTNVVKAVTTNINQLFLTFVLELLVIYIYAIFGFYFLDDNYFNGDVGAAGERTCTSMLQCYMTTLNYGLRNGGGIGESLIFQSYQEGNRNAYVFRLIFDVSFFIIINVVFLNIIFGIIIDTFAELRDKKSAMDEDMNTLCYICNLDRYTFDKNGTGFEKHIEKHHHLWNYLYYIYAVNAKDSTEYNGIESYVQEKLKEEDVSWFPLHKAIELGEDFEHEEEEEAGDD